MKSFSSIVRPEACSALLSTGAKFTIIYSVPSVTLPAK